MFESMKSPFDSESSDVDWCEPNYVVSQHIAEFWNTVSNIFFFLLPPLMIRLFTPYSKRSRNGLSILWIFLVIIGIGSVYFHGTLSLIGQLADEIPILWVLIAAYAIFVPWIPLYPALRNYRTRFAQICFAVGLIITLLSFIYPYANSFALMILGFPAIVVIAREMSRCENRQIKRLGIHCLVTWAIAVTIWICDRAFCSFWLSISFPYLHAFWHILIFFSSNEAIIIGAYLLADQQFPHVKTVIHAWPNASWGSFSIPYIKFEDDNDDNSSV